MSTMTFFLVVRINSHMKVSSTHAKHKGRLVGSKIRGISIYKISKRISRLLLYS